MTGGFGRSPDPYREIRQLANLQQAALQNTCAPQAYAGDYEAARRAAEQAARDEDNAVLLLLDQPAAA